MASRTKPKSTSSAATAPGDSKIAVQRWKNRSAATSLAGPPDQSVAETAASNEAKDARELRARVTEMTRRSPKAVAAPASTRHKYKVGQEVVFVPGKLGMPALRTTYKVTRHLPRENGENIYHIKSPAEIYERVAKESQLTFRV